MRKPYILYRRKQGAKRVYQIAFWDEDRWSYAVRVSADSLIRQLGERARHLSATSKAEADAAAKIAIEQGLHVRSRETLLSYLESFWAEGSAYLLGREARKKPLSAVYVINSRSAVKNYVRPFLVGQRKERLPLARVTAGLLEALTLHLQVLGLGPARINGIIKAVRVPLSQASKMGYIRENPARQIEKLPDPPPQRKILELAEARAFFSIEWEDPRYYAVNLIAATTGLRLGEIRGLRVEDLREDYIHVCHNWQDTEPEGRKLKGPKHSTLINVKTRDVPIPLRLAGVLRELVDRNPWRNGFVIWGNMREKPLSNTSIEKAFKAALEKIGISEEERRQRCLTFHAWRHWFNTNVRPYIPEYQLRMLTGHRDAAMTDHYTVITVEQRQAVAKIAEGLVPGDRGDAS